MTDETKKEKKRSTISRKMADDMLASGVIGQDAYDAMVAGGYVKEKTVGTGATREGRHAIKGKNGEIIFPMFYLKGFKKGAETPEITELKKTVLEIIASATFLYKAEKDESVEQSQPAAE